MDIKIVSYSCPNGGNLGDGIQALAMVEFLKTHKVNNYSFIDRKNMTDGMLINGWHRLQDERLPKHAIFLSIHTDYDHLKIIDSNNLIGCRDTFTRLECDRLKLRSLETGCVTINFPLVDISNNTDTIFIDSTHDKKQNFTQTLLPKTKWTEQYRLAIDRIQLLKQAALVHTTRLHILIPCIAMGVPVVLDKIPSMQPERFSLIKNFVSPNKVIDISTGIREELLDIWNNSSKKIIDHYCDKYKIKLIKEV